MITDAEVEQARVLLAWLKERGCTDRLLTAFRADLWGVLNRKEFSGIGVLRGVTPASFTQALHEGNAALIRKVWQIGDGAIRTLRDRIPPPVEGAADTVLAPLADTRGDDAALARDLLAWLEERGCTGRLLGAFRADLGEVIGAQPGGAGVLRGVTPADFTWALYTGDGDRIRRVWQVGDRAIRTLRRMIPPPVEEQGAALPSPPPPPSAASPVDSRARVQDLLAWIGSLGLPSRVSNALHQGIGDGRVGPLRGLDRAGFRAELYQSEGGKLLRVRGVGPQAITALRRVIAPPILDSSADFRLLMFWEELSPDRRMALLDYAFTLRAGQPEDAP